MACTPLPTQDRNQTPISAPAGLDSMPAALNTQVPMNLFCTWEEECSSPTCLPRLCSLSLTKLLIYRKLEKELRAVVISVRIQGSQKILRSDEILLPPSGHVNTDLALTFSFQYPHNLNRARDKLQIMLQKKLRVNTQTNPGHRTLAMGTIEMAEVMQRPLEGGRMLSLHSTIREAPAHVAEVNIASLSSQPIDIEDSTQRAGPKAQSRLRYSEVEYEVFLDQQGNSDPEQGQDQEEEDFAFEEPEMQRPRGGRSPLPIRQQDASDKVGAWLRRFPEWEEDLDLQQESLENVPEVEDMNLLYDALGDPSESSP